MSAIEEPEGVLELIVSAMTYEAEGVLGIELRDPDGGLLPSWSPGAHIDLWTPDYVRQYSLNGDPEDLETYRFAVLREQNSRGGSEYVHSVLRVGETVEVGGPRNHFELVPAKQYVFVAGGIGITPIMTMIKSAVESNISWSLLYGGRTRNSMAFLRQLSEYGHPVTVVPEDELGRLNLVSVLTDVPSDAAVYTCGPAGLLDAIESLSDGWPEGMLHMERFKSKDISDLPRVPVEVHCQRSDVTVDVPAENSILDGLEGAGISVPSACRDGVCGSCEVPILEGIPDHRDSMWSGIEGPAKSLMICVSRAKSKRLVLDI